MQALFVFFVIFVQNTIKSSYQQIYTVTFSVFLGNSRRKGTKNMVFFVIIVRKRYINYWKQTEKWRKSKYGRTREKSTFG